MDELDKRLYRELNSKIEIPSEFKTVIQESLNTDKEKKKVLGYPIRKVAIIASISLVLSVGIVYAGTAITNKIWKEPEKTIGFYSEENNITDISENKKYEGIMSEKQARENAKKILEKFGYKNEKIKSIELQNYPDNYDVIWCIETENNIFLSFDAGDGKYLSVTFNNILHKDIKNYRTTKEDAEITAKELCKKYGYDSTKYDDLKISTNLLSESDSYIWYVDFKRTYDGIVNPYESINIGFIPEINELYRFTIYDIEYDNNPVDIDKEKAIETAINNENKIDIGYKIINTSASLDIVRMNGDAYFRSMDYSKYKRQLEQNYPPEDYIEFRTEALVRKVWKVTIEYDIGETKNRIVDKDGVMYRFYAYYIDATTGEIIGGTPILKPYIKQ